VFSIGVFPAKLQSGRHGAVFNGEGVQTDMDSLDSLKSE
jgi:hypothetical protein